jgi:putative transposase
MAGTAVRDGTANLAMAHAVADITRTVSVETQRPSITVPPDLRPAQATVGAARDHSAENPDAARGLSDDCASFQSAVEIPETHDGEQDHVADTCRKHQYLILTARRKLKHRVPRPMPRNRVWGCDLLIKTDRDGRTHLAVAILDHASRACLRLQQLSDKSSWTLLQELIHAVKRYGRPIFLRTDNEAVLVSRLFRLGLRLLGIRHQRIQPGCPWQNGRVERFIGTVKRELSQEPLTGDKGLEDKLISIRAWYNHDRPHDHLQGRTPAEVWAGINVFAPRSRTGADFQQRDVRQDSG